MKNSNETAKIRETHIFTPRTHTLLSITILSAPRETVGAVYTKNVKREKTRRFLEITISPVYTSPPKRNKPPHFAHINVPDDIQPRPHSRRRFSRTPFSSILDPVTTGSTIPVCDSCWRARCPLIVIQPTTRALSGTKHSI